MDEHEKQITMNIPAEKTSIWAVGGGKGGTGKSFLTSSIACSLALKGRRTVLVDADLGGANLHNFLGLPKPGRSLTDFFEKKIDLNNIVVPTRIASLGLIAGSINSLDPERINHAQKQKLFRHIKALDVDKTLIDLGSGTHINTLDTFLFADRMIVVTVPEVTAIENMYQFIKSVHYLKLKSIFKNHNLNTLVQDTWENRASYNIHSLKDLVSHLKLGSNRIRDILDREMSDFTVYIVMNKVRNPRDIMVGENLRRICMNLLGLRAIYSGYVSYDEGVLKSINKKEIFMLSSRLSPIIREIGQITENIETGNPFLIPGELQNGRIR